MSKALVNTVYTDNLKDVPKFDVGNTVRVHQKIKEGNKERVQIFEGLVIKVNSGYGLDKTFTVRRVNQGFGVEKIFPLFSANIVKIEVTKKAKVRRSKLYYMRERFGKSARLKQKMLSPNDIETYNPLNDITEECNNYLELQAKVKAKATPEVKAEATPEVKVEATPEVKVEATPEVKAEATPEVKAEATPEVKEEKK